MSIKFSEVGEALILTSSRKQRSARNTDKKGWTPASCEAKRPPVLSRTSKDEYVPNMPLWARLDNAIWWPGRVVNGTETSEESKRQEEGVICVKYFGLNGSKAFAYLKSHELCPYSNDSGDFCSQNIPEAFGTINFERAVREMRRLAAGSYESRASNGALTQEGPKVYTHSSSPSDGDATNGAASSCDISEHLPKRRKLKPKGQDRGPGNTSSRQLNAKEAHEVPLVSEKSSMNNDKRERLKQKVLHGERVRSDGNADTPHKKASSSGKALGRLNTQETVKKKKEKKTGADGYYFECMVCDVGGDLLCCDRCPGVYHLECLKPPLKRTPPGTWMCPTCRDSPGAVKGVDGDKPSSGPKLKKTKVTENSPCLSRSGALSVGNPGRKSFGKGKKNFEDADLKKHVKKRKQGSMLEPPKKKVVNSNGSSSSQSQNNCIRCGTRFTSSLEHSNSRSCKSCFEESKNQDLNEDCTQGGQPGDDSSHVDLVPPRHSKLKAGKCDTCTKSGLVMFCDMCPRGYHKDCLYPPRKRAPKGPWTCPACGSGKSATDDKGVIVAERGGQDSPWVGKGVEEAEMVVKQSGTGQGNLDGGEREREVSEAIVPSRAVDRVLGCRKQCEIYTYEVLRGKRGTVPCMTAEALGLRPKIEQRSHTPDAKSEKERLVDGGGMQSVQLLASVQQTDFEAPSVSDPGCESRRAVIDNGGSSHPTVLEMSDEGSSKACQSSSEESANPNLDQRGRNDDPSQLERHSGEMRKLHAGNIDAEVIGSIQGTVIANVEDMCVGREDARNNGVGDLVAAETTSDSRNVDLADMPRSAEVCSQRIQGAETSQTGCQAVGGRSVQKCKGIEISGSLDLDGEDSSGDKADVRGRDTDAMPAAFNESGDTVEARSPHSSAPKRLELEFLVKWNGVAHIHNEWLGEEVLGKMAKRKLVNYKQKHGCVTKTLVDKQWLVPERVIARRSVSRDGSQVLVKWCGLQYDECTWESEEHPVIGAHADLLTAFDRFEQEALALDAELLLGQTDCTDHPDVVRPPQLETIREQPSYLKGGSLFPHQMEAFNWLRRCWHRKQSVILADEMGLGKTISACTFVASLRQEFKVRAPCLVLVPLSTMGNWRAEFAAWAPSLNVIEYHGCAKARALIREYEWFANSSVGEKESSNRLFKFNVILTTYEMILADASQLRAVPWEALIVDEGHRLKNSSSKLFTILNTFSFSHRILLTGTPWQNNVGELFNLLNFIQPNLFPSPAAFQEKFSSLSSAEFLDELRRIVAPNMLRRLKRDVMQTIPPKMELVVPVDMSSVQKEYYRALLTRNYQLLRSGGKQQSMLNIVMQLRKVCNHPYLVSGTEPESGTTRFLQEMRIKASAKLMLLHSMLGKLRAGGHRVLIFSQMTKLLDILEDYLIFEFGQGAFERVDGSVSAAERQAAIARFNRDERRFVFLLSTRACGLGINLATADTVIIYDSDFNPQSDIQAMNRAHRIGQSKTLLVYRFVVRASVEERILQLAKKKLMLDHLFAQKTGSQKEVDDILRWGTEELFRDSRSQSGDHGSAEGTGDDGEAVQKKKGGDLEDLYGDYYMQLGRTNVVWDEAAVVRLLDRSNVSSNCKSEALQGDSESDFLGTFKAWDWNGHDVTNEQQDGDAIVAEETGMERPLKATEYEADNQWDKLLKSRWEAMQIDEVASFGRGKRTRKAVLYAESNGQKSEDVPSESSDAEKEEHSGPIQFPDGRAIHHKMSRLRARQKDRILQRRLWANGQVNANKPPGNPVDGSWRSYNESIDVHQESKPLVSFDPNSTSGVSGRSSQELRVQDKLIVNDLPSSLAAQEVLTVSPGTVEVTPSKRATSPPGFRTSAERDAKRKMSYALKFSPITNIPQAAQDNIGNGPGNAPVQKSWLGGVAPFSGNLAVMSQTHESQMSADDHGQVSGISSIPLSTVSRSLESGQSLSQLLPTLRQSLKGGTRYCSPSESVAKLELQGYTTGRSESTSLDCASQHQEAGCNGITLTNVAKESKVSHGSRIRDERIPCAEMQLGLESLGVGLELSRKTASGRKVMSSDKIAVFGEDSVTEKRTTSVKDNTSSIWSVDEKPSLKLQMSGIVPSHNSMSPNLSITLGLPSSDTNAGKAGRNCSSPPSCFPSSTGGSPGKLNGQHIRDGWQSRGVHIPSELGFSDANPIEINDDEFEPTAAPQKLQISEPFKGSTDGIWHQCTNQELTTEGRGHQPWDDDELDALWSGVRRHGRGNWAAMLLDAKLYFLQSRSVGELAERWSDEEKKMLGDTSATLSKIEKQIQKSWSGNQAGAARIYGNHDVRSLSSEKLKRGVQTGFLRTSRKHDPSLFREREDSRQVRCRDDDSLLHPSDLDLNSSRQSHSLSSSRIQHFRSNREQKMSESEKQGLNTQPSLDFLSGRSSPSTTPVLHHGLSFSVPAVPVSAGSAGAIERFLERGFDKIGRLPSTQHTGELGLASNSEVTRRPIGDKRFWHDPSKISSVDIELSQPGSLERNSLFKDQDHLQRFVGETPRGMSDLQNGGQSLGFKTSESLSQPGGLGLTAEHRRKARGGLSKAKSVLSSSDDSASSRLPHWLREAVKARSTPPQPPLPPAICAVVQAGNMVYVNKKRLLPPLVHPGYPSLPPRDFPKKVDRKQQRLRKRFLPHIAVDPGTENLRNSSVVNLPFSVKTESLNHSHSFPPPVSEHDWHHNAPRVVPTAQEVSSSLQWTESPSGLPLLSGLDHPLKQQASPVHAGVKSISSKKMASGIRFMGDDLHTNFTSTIQPDEVNSQASSVGRRGRPWFQLLPESSKYRDKGDTSSGNPPNAYAQEKRIRTSKTWMDEGGLGEEDKSHQLSWLRASDSDTTGGNRMGLAPRGRVDHEDDGDDSTSSKTVSDPGVHLERRKNVSHSDDASSEETISDDGTR